MKTFIVSNEKEVSAKLAAELERIATAALSSQSHFYVGLSGGSVVNFLAEAIPQLSEAKLKQCRFYFCDERHVEEYAPDSTFGIYKQKLIATTTLKEEQFACINMDLPLQECALDYETRLKQEFAKLPQPNGMPQFDLLLLGMGPDGHTCSLFPGHALLKEQKRLIAPIANSPKPPPGRVTMTLPLINNAKNCLFAMAGASKADMVKRVFVDRDLALPAAMVAPKDGDLIVICDEAAGKYLK